MLPFSEIKEEDEMRKFPAFQDGIEIYPHHSYHGTGTFQERRMPERERLGKGERGNGNGNATSYDTSYDTSSFDKKCNFLYTDSQICFIIFAPPRHEHTFLQEKLFKNK